MARADRDDDNTEQRILQAARVVFVRRGTAGARMQEIAEEAGVNQALLHYYFRSKDRLAGAVFREAAGRLIPGVVEVFGSAAPLEKKVERFVHLYIDTVRRNPFIPAYVLSELHYHPERLQVLVRDIAGPNGDAAPGVIARLGAELSAGMAAGTIRPIEPIQLLLNLMGLVAAPFLALPALNPLLGIDEAAFERLLDERRADLPGFIMRALRP